VEVDESMEVYLEKKGKEEQNKFDFWVKYVFGPLTFSEFWN